MGSTYEQKRICVKAKCVSIVVLTCHITVIFCASATDLGWDRSVETIPLSYYSVSTTNVLRCGNLCERQGKCASVTFDVRERKCYMHDTLVTTSTTEKASTGRYLNKNYPNESKPENTCDESTQISVPTVHHRYGRCYNIIDKNDCESLPCKNNATCEDGQNDYYCNCQAGYTGKNCSVEINECSSAPCKNNGTCEDRVNDYFCRCTCGLTGKNCSDERGCPTSLGYTYEQHLDLCFRMEGDTGNVLSQTKAICELECAHLIFIKNNTVDLFLVDEIFKRGLDANTGHFFIDGSDKDQENIWINYAGDVMNYTNFHVAEPDSGRYQNCLAISKARNYQWADAGCGDESKTGGYICQIDMF